MDAIRSVALIAATMSMGLVAGAFLLYAHAVMPGLKRVDNRTFVAGFQAIDRAIINPWFMITSFMGALLFTLTAALLHIGESPQVWIYVAFALYLIAFIITMVVNVPLNDALKAAGDPGQIADLEAVRSAFDEAKWSRWNLVRTVLSCAAFACLTAALLVS